jgi:hypothetical protein
VEVKAANILALLFGREEVSDDETVAVPGSVIGAVLQHTWDLLQGKAEGHFVYATQALLALSVSDANTRSMVAGGVLTLVGAVLSQGMEIAADRNAQSSYVVAAARAAVLMVLLNLALSDATVQRVVEHAEVRAGLVHAAADQLNLTHKAQSLLKQLNTRLKMVDGQGQRDQIERVHECAASARHVMISYCWYGARC